MPCGSSLHSAGAQLAPDTMALAVDVPLSVPDRRTDPLRVVRAWLFTLAGLVILMAAVGAATRLTGSGLSITEWKPVTGAIPPLSEAAWLVEFEKYRQIPQYKLLNQGMTLSEFKEIYAWEWGHRQLGRLIGLAFFAPLAWFWLRGALTMRLAATLLGIGALGGLQAAVGWIMVASGLEPGMTAVAPIKLTLHLLIASAILVCLVWVASGLTLGAPGPEAGTAARRGSRVLLGLVLVQIAAGGLVAGSKAGLTYNTWPLMDGELIPAAAKLFVVSPWIENFIDNVTLVQFNHRLLAYAVVALAIWHAWRLAHDGASAAACRARALTGLTLAQGALGISTLLLVVPLWAGVAHQILALLILAMAAVHARLSGRTGHPAVA